MQTQLEKQRFISIYWKIRYSVHNVDLSRQGSWRSSQPCSSAMHNCSFSVTVPRQKSLGLHKEFGQHHDLNLKKKKNCQEKKTNPIRFSWIKIRQGLNSSAWRHSAVSLPWSLAQALEGASVWWNTFWDVTVSLSCRGAKGAAQRDYEELLSPAGSLHLLILNMFHWMFIRHA